MIYNHGLHDLTVNKVQFVNLTSQQELKLTVAHRQRIAEVVHNECIYRYFPTFTNWLPDEPRDSKCVEMASKLKKSFQDYQEDTIMTGWRTVHCNKGTFFICEDRNFYITF